MWQCAVPVVDRELLKRIKLQAAELGSPALVAPSPESPIVQKPAARKQRFETITARSLQKEFVKPTVKPTSVAKPEAKLQRMFYYLYQRWTTLCNNSFNMFIHPYIYFHNIF